MLELMIRDPGRHCPDCGQTGVLDFTNALASVRTYAREDGNYADHNGPSRDYQCRNCGASFTLNGWENSQVGIDAARKFLAAEFESAGLPHVAGGILAGTSPFGQGAYITSVAAALTAPCAACGCAKEAAHG